MNIMVFQQMILLLDKIIWCIIERLHTARVLPESQTNFKLAQIAPKTQEATAEIPTIAAELDVSCGASTSSAGHPDPGFVISVSSTGRSNSKLKETVR